jgi:hypothetical protein
VQNLSGSTISLSTAVTRANVALLEGVEFETRQVLNNEDLETVGALLTPLSTVGADGLNYTDALTPSEAKGLIQTIPEPVLPPLEKAVMAGAVGDFPFVFGFKPVSLEADFQTNRVSMTFGPGVTMTQPQFNSSTLMQKVLGYTSIQNLAGTQTTFNTLNTP